MVKSEFMNCCCPLPRTVHFLVVERFKAFQLSAMMLAEVTLWEAAKGVGPWAGAHAPSGSPHLAARQALHAAVSIAAACSPSLSLGITNPGAPGSDWGTSSM